jgi:monofunctional biosynthetic peptidoglycan transglycosylase
MMALSALAFDDLSWVVVNDTVMGGVSSSSIEVADPMTFSGTLSLEQNGGFVSMRARTPAGAFDGARAVRLELDGDGRTYDLTLRRWDVPLRAGSYRAPIVTQVGRTVVEVPLSVFRPTSFGREVQGAPSLDAALDRIDTIGIMLADKNPGDFVLKVHAVELVGGAAPRAASHLQAAQRLVDAVSLGVPAFNSGDIAGCRDLYAAALGDVQSDPGLTKGERALVSEALAQAGGQDASGASWTLRYAIDSILTAVAAQESPPERRDSRPSRRGGVF